MEFGIQLVGNTPQDILDMAALAEKVGIKNAFVPDHFAMESPGGAGLSPDQPVWEAIAILGAMAERTSTLEVGALVLCNLFRHPALTAQAVATIDRISGGRAILGLGSGWTKAEFDMTGVGFPTSNRVCASSMNPSASFARSGPRIARISRASSISFATPSFRLAPNVSPAPRFFWVAAARDCCASPRAMPIWSILLSRPVRPGPSC